MKNIIKPDQWFMKLDSLHTSILVVSFQHIKEINRGHTYIKNFLRNTRYTRGTKQVK